MEEIRSARAAGDYAAVSALIPYARLMGIVIGPDPEERDDPSGVLLVRLPYRDDLIGRPGSGSLHGGLLGAFLEHAAIMQLLWRGESEHLPRIINFHIDYLRPGGEAETFARVDILRQGRRVANVHARAWQGERQRPIAAARGHFLLTPPED
nr:PaaI family thioesterase [Halorhodospira abdelmalekii]